MQEMSLGEQSCYQRAVCNNRDWVPSYFKPLYFSGLKQRTWDGILYICTFQGFAV